MFPSSTTSTLIQLAISNVQLAMCNDSQPRKMKYSGVEWIGDIPEDWETIKFSSFIDRMGTGLNPRDNFVLDKDSPYYYVTIRNFKNGKLFLDDKCDRIDQTAFDKIQERSQLQIGDFLFASISKDAQVYYVSETPSNWNINESVFCIRPKRNIFLSEYLYYHLIDYRFYESLLTDATGSTFLSIKQNKLRQSFFVLPPLSEQQAIADILDRKCTQIDALIANEEQQIAKLKAYKQSVITETVTKGINPDVPMKDSGVEWIGEIPEHWEIVRIKNKFSLRNERNYEADLSRVNLISLYTDLGVIQHSDLEETTGNKAVTAEGYKIVHEGDIIVNIILCWMGAVGKSNYNGVTSPAYDVYQPKSDTNSNYYHYLFRTKRFNGECYRYGRGIMMMRWRTYSTEFSSIS